MDAKQVNKIGTFFSEKRRSRRAAMKQAAAVAAAGVVAGGLSAAGQEGTPEADADDAPRQTEFLFVQSFQSGSIAAKDGEAGAYTVTLEHGLGQTLYFSNRPERIVGVAPTATFLENFDFDPENPPNAALVISSDDGETDIAVVELTNPVYDEATSTATYDMQLLENFDNDGHAFQSDPVDLAEIASSFGAAHLLIDSCEDKPLYCRRQDGDGVYYTVGDPFLGIHGMCWDRTTWVCLPCGEGDLHAICVLEHGDWCTGTYDCRVWT